MSPLPFIEVSQIVVTVPVVGSESNRLTVRGFRISRASGILVRVGQPIQRIGVPRVQLQRSLKLFQRELVFSRRVVDSAQRYVSLRQITVLGGGLGSICQRQFRPLWVLVDLKLQKVRLTQARISKCKLRISTHRARQRCYGLIQISRLVVSLHIPQRLQIRLRSEEHTSELQSLRHLVCR